jgi:aspartyl-tRNA(Asn)/glutamyl-tRNA(Gln) amidotransferase subunit C
VTAPDGENPESVDDARRSGDASCGEGSVGSEIDATKVREVARLARLELDPDEVARLVEEMSSILSHFDALDTLRIETEGRAPRGRDLDARTRADAPGSDPLASGPEALAPDWRDGYFVVPRLPALGEEEG